MFRKKIKKYTAVFLTLTSLILVNLSLFSVGAHANTVSDNNYSYRTVGAPVTMRYMCNMSGTGSEIDYGVCSRPNVYYYDLNTNGAYSWIGNSGGTDIFEFAYSGISNGVADIFLYFDKPTSFYSIGIDSPIIFNDFQDLDDHFNFLLGCSDPHSISGVDLNNTYVTFYYRYEFAVGNMSDDGFFYMNSVVIEDSVSFYVDSSVNKIYVPLFNHDVLTDNVIRDYCEFSDRANNRYAILLKAEMGSPQTFFTDCFFEPFVYGANQELSYYSSVLNSRFDSIYVAESYVNTTVFEEISWTGWLVNAIGGFMDFELIPGLTFAGMLALLIGMSLFIVFLKIFAGG